MALTKLNIFSDLKRKPVEKEDVRIVFEKTLKKFWPELKAPVTFKNFRKGVITATSASAPWRSEIYWSEIKLKEEINKELNQLDLVKKIRVYLG